MSNNFKNCLELNEALISFFMLGVKEDLTNVKTSKQNFSVSLRNHKKKNDV